MRFYDISTPLHPRVAVYPGDPPFSAEPVVSASEGGAFTLSALGLGSHTGTHVDPPLHFFPGTTAVDALDLERMNGECLVFEVGGSAREITGESLRLIPTGTTRLLLKTANSARWAGSERYFAQYVALGESAARELVTRRVALVGIDALSVDLSGKGPFPAHRTLLGEGVVILEGLRLHDVPAGRYELRCLPLRIQGGDGAPARAVLVAPGG